MRSVGPALVPLVLLLLSACSRGDSNNARRSTAPAASVTVVAATPAAPPAAGIATVPRTPAPVATRPPDVAAAESTLRRVALFATDLPPTLVARPPVLVTRETAPQPSDARRFGLLATLTAVFEAAGDDGRSGMVAAGSGAARYEAVVGAQAEVNALRIGGFRALQAEQLYPGGLAPEVTASEPEPPPAVGEEALAWRLIATTGGESVPGSAIVLRRGAIVVVVVVFGAGDVTALARTLDARARDAQRP